MGVFSNRVTLRACRIWWRLGSNPRRFLRIATSLYRAHVAPGFTVFENPPDRVRTHCSLCGAPTLIAIRRFLPLWKCERVQVSAICKLFTALHRENRLFQRTVEGDVEQLVLVLRSPRLVSIHRQSLRGTDFSEDRCRVKTVPGTSRRVRVLVVGIRFPLGFAFNAIQAGRLFRRGGIQQVEPHANPISRHLSADWRYVVSFMGLACGRAPE